MSLCTRTYSIAGFGIAVSMPQDLESRLQAMQPFLAPDMDSDQCISQITISRVDECPLAEPYGTKLEEYVSDLGVVAAYEPKPDTYIITVDDTFTPHATIEANEDFSRCTIWTAPDTALHTVMSALRIVYSQAIALHGAFAVHASCVTVEGKAYLFTGKSGAGKSTQSKMWLQAIPGATLLNDDCVIVRVLENEGTAIAAGSPWSGKTPCYINAAYPVAAIERIMKSESNRLILHQDVEAFNAVLPGCSAMRQRGDFFAAVCDTLAHVTAQAQIGTLYCQATHESAIYNLNTLNNPINK